jgi:hypothetical protein
MTQMVGQSLGNPPHATTRRKPIWKTFFLGCLVIHFTQVDDPQDQSCFGVLWFDRGPRALLPAPRLTFFLFRRKESQQRKRRPCREHHLLRGILLWVGVAAWGPGRCRSARKAGAFSFWPPEGWRQVHNQIGLMLFVAFVASSREIAFLRDLRGFGRGTGFRG